MSVELVQAHWEAIGNWLKANRPTYLEALNPAAPEERIQQLESSLGLTLPAEVRASLAVHDGQACSEEWVIGGRFLLDCESIESNWKCNTDILNQNSDWKNDEVADGVKPAWWSPAWWSPGWIPWVGNGAGDFTCIDLDPGDGGRVGQIIEFVHDSLRRPLKANSLADWMAAFVEMLEAGTAYNDDDDDWDE